MERGAHSGRRPSVNRSRPAVPRTAGRAERVRRPRPRRRAPRAPPHARRLCTLNAAGLLFRRWDAHSPDPRPPPTPLAVRKGGAGGRSRLPARDLTSGTSCSDESLVLGHYFKVPRSGPRSRSGRLPSSSATPSSKEALLLSGLLLCVLRPHTHPPVALFAGELGHTLGYPRATSGNLG